LESFVKECETRFGIEIGRPIEICDKLIITDTNHYIAFNQGDPEPEIKGMEGIKTDRPAIFNQKFDEFARLLREQDKTDMAIQLVRDLAAQVKSKELGDKPEIFMIEKRLHEEPGSYKSAGILQKRLGIYQKKHKGDILRYYDVEPWLEKVDGNTLAVWQDPANISVSKYLMTLHTVFGNVLRCLGADPMEVIGNPKNFKLSKPKNINNNKKKIRA
jgi:hypothetical protein